MRSHLLILTFFSLCVITPQAKAQELLGLIPLGDGSRYACAEDDLGIFLARIFSDGVFEVRFRRTLRKQKRKLRRLQRRRTRLARRGASEERISAIQVKIDARTELINGIIACRDGALDPSGGNTGGTPTTPNPGSACLVVGATGTRTIHNRRIERIIQGDTCSIGNSPVVELEMYDSSNDILFGCTGTAVTQRSVIFAAHCIESRVATILVKSGLSTLPAASFHAHPSFNSGGFLETNDVAILILGQDIGTRTINLHTAADMAAGEQVIIAGYGLDENGGSGTLKAGYMTVASANDSGIGANFNGTGSNTCSGDSGGPLLVQRNGTYVLAGVTSNGEIPTCGKGDRSYFANLSNPSNASFMNGLIQ